MANQVPTKSIVFNTDLATYGTGKTVTAGVMYYDFWGGEVYPIKRTVNLVDSVYMTEKFTDDVRFFGYIENRTGGEVVGSFSLYSLDHM